LWCFIRSDRDFIHDFWKILKVLLKTILICEIFLFQNFSVYYLFFYFFIIFDILFSISSICSCQKILEILIFLFYVLEMISKNFENHGMFLKKYRHSKFKILHKFHRLLFVFFYSFSILVIFFSISPIQTCQKILNIL